MIVSKTVLALGTLAMKSFRTNFSASHREPIGITLIYKLPMKNLKPKNLSGRMLHPWLSPKTSWNRNMIYIIDILYPIERYRKCFTNTFLTVMQGRGGTCNPQVLLQVLGCSAHVRPRRQKRSGTQNWVKKGYLHLQKQGLCGMGCSH